MTKPFESVREYLSTRLSEEELARIDALADEEAKHVKPIINKSGRYWATQWFQMFINEFSDGNFMIDALEHYGFDVSVFNRSITMDNGYLGRDTTYDDTDAQHLNVLSDEQFWGFIQEYVTECREYILEQEPPPIIPRVKSDEKLC
jgi:hypothetical protein